MTAPTVAVTIILTAQDGLPIKGASVSAKLDRDELYQGVILKQNSSGTTDAAGLLVMYLFPNRLGTQGSSYLFKIVSPVDGHVLNITAVIPNSPCNLWDVSALASYPAAILGQAEAIAAMTAATSATASAVNAANSAAAAASTVAGLSNVNNTSDINKPVSTAQAAADAVVAANFAAADLADRNSLAASGGSALVGHISPATGSVARTVQDKLREETSLADVGAVGDGITNDSTPMLNAITYDDAQVATSKIYAVAAPSPTTPVRARVNKLYGRGAVRKSDRLGAPNITDIDQLDMTGLGRTIGGANLIAMTPQRHYANLATLYAALLAGSCKVSFMGTSLTENNGNQSYFEGTWLRQVEKMFDEAFPLCNFTYSNLGLNGTSSVDAVNTAFVPGAGLFPTKTQPTTFPIGLGWWPRGAKALDAITSCVVAGGTGYTQGATVTFSAPAAGGQQATGFLNVTAGVPTSITMTCMGDGYSGLTPTASVAGGAGGTFTPAVGSKNYLDFVRDSQPDVLFIDEGMNDGGTSTNAFAANIDSIVAVTKTWVKVPTLCFVATYIPTRLITPYNTIQDLLGSHARAMRALASKHQALLVDTSRMFYFLRDGVDDVHHSVHLEANLANWSTWWSVVSGTPPTGSSTLTGSGNYQAIRTGMTCRDGRIDLTFTATNTGQVPQIVYRSNEGTFGNGYTVQYGGGNVALYHHGVLQASASVGVISIVAPTYISVEFIDQRHRVYINNKLWIDVKDYNSFQTGSIGFGVAGTAAASTITASVRIGQPRKLGRPLMSEDEIVGLWQSTDPLGWNANSQGLLGSDPSGNAINHPTTYAHAAMYTAACGEMFRRILDYYQAKN